MAVYTKPITKLWHSPSYQCRASVCMCVCGAEYIHEHVTKLTTEMSPWSQENGTRCKWSDAIIEYHSDKWDRPSTPLHTLAQAPRPRDFGVRSTPKTLKNIKEFFGARAKLPNGGAQNMLTFYLPVGATSQCSASELLNLWATSAQIW